jgi:hypothetical protein
MLYYKNMNNMKHQFSVSLGTKWFLVFILLISCRYMYSQESSGGSAPLPDSINNIVSVSCMPCHSSRGGLLSRSKLNFSEWTDYPADKQKKKAEKMYKELKKGKMPPEEARENNPDIIPTPEQIAVIKAWSDSF